MATNKNSRFRTYGEASRATESFIPYVTCLCLVLWGPSAKGPNQYYSNSFSNGECWVIREPHVLNVNHQYLYCPSSSFICGLMKDSWLSLLLGSDSSQLRLPWYFNCSVLIHTQFNKNRMWPTFPPLTIVIRGLNVVVNCIDSLWINWNHDSLVQVHGQRNGPSVKKDISEL